MVTRFHPDNVQIEVTEDCNHDCFYCYNHWRTDNPSRRKMSVDTASKLVDILKNDVKPFDVTLTGGEPMMNLPAVTTLAAGLNRPYGINTNLSILTPEKLEIILEANPLLTVLASVPSLKRKVFNDIVGRDRLQSTISGLNVLVSAGIPVHANMVVHALNLKEVYESGKILHEDYGVTSFSVTPVLRPAGKEDSPHYLDRDGVIKALESTISLGEDMGMRVNVLEVVPPCYLPEHLRKIEILQKGCSAGRSTMQINYKGGARVCTQSPLDVGNLFTDGFAKIWKNMEPYRQNENIPDDCIDCSSLSSCGGGCRFEGYQKGDPLNRKDSRMREPIKDIKPLWNPDKVENNRNYKLRLAMTREEPDGTFTLYNGRQTINVNRELNDFVMELRETNKKFRVNDYSPDIRSKAEYIGMQLLDKEFLI